MTDKPPRLRPSASHIWTRCPGFVPLTERLPAFSRIETDPTREGTCAAWVAEVTLGGHVTRCSDMVGEAHVNGWVVDEAMAGYVQNYVDLLRDRYGDAVVAERKFALTDDIAGTPDAHAVVQIGPTRWCLNVDDLKYGYDVVEPWDNTQVIIYAGAIARNTALPAGHTFTQVSLGIYQPRAFHTLGPYRTWQPTVEELSVRLAAIIEAGNAALSPDALCIAGAHCRRCDAASSCSAVAHEAYRAVSTMRNQDQRPMTAREMATELDFLELAERVIKGRRDAVHAEAEARIARGELIPGWTVESGKGQRRWKFDATTVRLWTGIDPLGGKRVTPAELERRGADKAVVKTLTETPSTAPKLKRFSSHVAAGKFGDIPSGTR